MFKQSKHRQQDPEAGQKSWGGVWAVPFHLAAAEADQDRPQFRGLRCASACNCQTTTQAIDATSKRRAMAGPVSCCHCSSCWPWLLSNLK